MGRAFERRCLRWQVRSCIFAARRIHADLFVVTCAAWRYSMLVRDGVIEKMFVESDVPGDPFSVSDADTMLSYLDPNAGRPSDIAVFSRPGCAFCAKAKGLLRDAGMEFEELVLNRDYTDQTLRAVADATSYPQVFVDGTLIGGADELEKWLDARVSAAA